MSAADPTSAAEPPAPTPTVSIDPAPPVVTAAPEMSSSDSPAPPQPGATPVASAPAPTAEPTPAPTNTATPTAPAAAEPEKPEPQNALTEKFTGYEWKALAEFRKLVPDSLVKAYEKPEAKTTAITLWGVRIDPNDLVDARTSVVLMKFLRARHGCIANLNATAAAEMFVATLRWRDEFKVDDLLKEEFPQDVFGQLGHIYGRDKEGRPVVYNVYGGNQDLDAVFGDVDRFLRWRVAFMEKSVAMLNFETVDQTIQVHDYEGVSMSSRTPASKAAASQASNIFSSHYPELLFKKFFVNVPSYMSFLFWVFKAILPAATFAKMSVVGSSPRAIGKALLPYVAAEELPTRYGGSAGGWEKK
ncbi:CRAL-TRIO domain-containing protein [Mycena sanguinolenta]|uniref:CRAL-TRIO domain-containing protein n=1 Tax=Mycena sanguinolenta TaxID=230812 RepID=A0A8H7DDZ2_9AGAR|nr:CRAL-TRIO domain-containing protein [Mycena sanguinolenta]